MTEEEISTLLSETEKLISIIENNCAIDKNGTFDTEKVKTTIIQLTQEVLKEEAEVLINWMEKNEFWTSPASTKFHGNKAGGLAAHSLMVADQALRFAPSIAQNFMRSPKAKDYTFTAKDVFIAAIAHDFCKAGFYTSEYRRTKDYNGNFKYESFFKAKSDNRGLGHGNESVLRLIEAVPSFISNRTVIEAISRHMGFSDLTFTEQINYTNFIENPLVVLIQLADQTSAQWWDI